MTLDDLRTLASDPDRQEPEILSLEGMTYIVRVGEELLCRAEGTTLQFNSAHAAGRALAAAGIEQGWLVHRSPYDEMIGRGDTTPPEPLRVPMRFSTV